jgi:signal transduction histidine kinase
MQHSSPESQIQPAHEAVRAASLADVFKGQPMSLLVMTIIAMITAVVMLQVMPLPLVGAWYAAIVCLCLARLWLYRRYMRAAETATALDLQRFERQFVAGALLSGALWGSLSIIMFPRDSSLQVFLAFVLSGMAAGAVTTLSALRYAAFGYVLLSVLPLAIQLAFLGTRLSAAMSLMVVAFLAGVSTSINRLHAQIVALVKARVDADSHLRELEAAQVDVQALNERLTIATQAARLGVWEWDLRTQQLLWDARMYEMYAVERDVPLSYEVHRERIHPLDIARLEARLQALRRNFEEFDEEFRIVWPDRTERTIRTAAKAQRGPDGRATRIVGVNWDITEIKRLERLKGEFVSIVSHELRTPLTSIRGSLGLLGGGVVGDLPSKVREFVQMADRNAERLAALIDDLLDMDKIESGKLVLNEQSQPIMPLIEQALEANTGYAHMRHVSYRLVARYEASVHVDALRLLQVMANLLSNAAKFSPADAIVMIAVAKCERGVRVEVRDRGPGISGEFQQRIFSKFAQGDSSDARAKSGTGLGLAISKALIEQMRGVIGYSAQSAGGTVFFVELPEVVVQEAAAATVVS